MVRYRIFEKESLNVTKKLKESESNPCLFFINAWNEWGEENYLETDRKNNRTYLQAMKKAIDYNGS